MLQESAREREHSGDEESAKTPTGSVGLQASSTKSSHHAGSGPLPDSTTPTATSNPVCASCSHPPEEQTTSGLRGTLQNLSAENKLLRERLLQLGVSLDSSPLSDQEKELLLSKVCSVSQVSGKCVRLAHHMPELW